MCAKGRFFGLLGPNGAGKTTTLRCIEGLRKPDGGAISVLGVQPGSSKKPGMRSLSNCKARLADTMTPRESPGFFLPLSSDSSLTTGSWKDGAFEEVRRSVRHLSTGQKRRLSLASLRCPHPELLFLDEPTAGLDVESRMELHAIMRELRESGKNHHPCHP